MRALPTLAVLVVAGAAGLAVAQQAGRPTLHEDIAMPNDSQQLDLRAIGGTGSGMPAAIKAGDKIIPKPSLSDPAAAPKDEPVLGAGGFAADRQTQMKPDDNTGPDSTLHYVSVFNPDVLPFKRMSAFDAIADDYTLRVGRTALTELAVGGTTDNTRDYFRASVLVQLAPGKDVPLPSVAPDMRILSYEIKPKIAIRFEKDGADNFYVRTDESSANGNYRLIFDCDADAGYFAPSLPTGNTKLTPRVVATLTPPGLRPIVPAPVAASAKVTLDKLGLDADMELGAAFNKLVGYFRAFEAKPLPPSSGNLYRDLCDSQAGVCRHRAFAFMITANALGIPTRYVENEAHAFVEVWFPGKNWQRVDLGGAALRMEVSGADDKTLHRPRADDPFAKPDEYKNNYTQLQGDISGLTQQQKDDKLKPLDQSPPSGAVGSGGGGGLGGLGGGSNSATPPSTGPDKILPGIDLPAVAMDPKKKNPKLEITRADASAYRGSVLRVEARVTVNGAPLPNHSVDVFLAPAGQQGMSSKPLGRAVTGPDGTFRQDFTVPGSLNLATYELFLSSSPDAYYNAALSD
ncbi:MAG TPA: transglutaminase domain-containing protein [Kofleriaceae bacterium]|nr:transglutaminase domain-containing protein [Kofleriaceae bacterium]